MSHAVRPVIALLAAALFTIAPTALSPAHAATRLDDKADATKSTKAVGIGHIEIHGALSEIPHPLAWLMGSGDHATMRDMLALIKEAAEDDELSGLVIRLREATLSLTQVEELGSAIQEFRKGGKKVHLFADGYSTTELVLGSYCDEIMLQQGGGIEFPGMYMEEMYLADTMAWAGLTPQMVQVGDYKGVNEQYMRTAPSPQWEENISGLLDALYGNVRTRIKQARKLDDAKLDEAMKQCWMALGETGTRVGLIDSTFDLPALSKHLEKSYSGEIDWHNYDVAEATPKLDTSNPFSMLSKMFKEPNHSPTRDAIAIVHINGPIVDGESSEGGFLGESSVGSHTIRRALSEIEEEDLFKGVVVRIDSPGGSAIASEVIWQGITRLSETRPVWVSVGSMAASGGYYCLVAGQKVYVNPSSIVGSIGVVGGKIAMTGLYDKLKVRVHGRERGPMGGMLASSSPWTDAEQAAVRQKMQETYDLFTSRVSAGRKGIDLSKTAEGRLFAGNDAVKLKMADAVGGLNDCVRDLAKELKLVEGDYQILEFPGPRSLSEVLGDMMGPMASSPNPMAATAQNMGEHAGVGILSGTLKMLVGEKHWPAVRDHLSALMQLREQRVILTSPRAIIVK
ncbi:MAG: S49 family peptidase [Phycisphaerales bacterium]|nr:S49 family peptidase [Phycisphaerales bacterium]